MRTRVKKLMDSFNIRKKNKEISFEMFGCANLKAANVRQNEALLVGETKRRGRPFKNLSEPVGTSNYCRCSCRSL